MWLLSYSILPHNCFIRSIFRGEKTFNYNKLSILKRSRYQRYESLDSFLCSDCACCGYTGFGHLLFDSQHLSSASIDPSFSYVCEEYASYLRGWLLCARDHFWLFCVQASTEESSCAKSVVIKEI